MNVLVSIIVPCFNQAQYLDEALQSVFEQTHTNWECIIVNDGSSDNTEEVAKKWMEIDMRFKYLFKDNGGLSSARNAGIKIAKGDYIQFLDSDDLIESEKISAQVEALVSDQEIDISVSGYRYFEGSMRELKAMGRNNFFPEVVLHKNDSDLKEVLFVKNPMVISAAIYKKIVFEKVGFFDEELVSLEDWDFHTRCALQGIKFQHIGIITNTRTLVRLHDKSMMRNDVIMKIGSQLFLNKRNQNQLYLQHFPVNDIVIPVNEIVISKSRCKYFKTFIKMFIPPIFLIIKRKLF
ncbi:MAG: glycosyltransferase [Lutibacter sp.]|nr:glycosyltransferase [Lutibacter sp.]